jgi:hypothetical protein
MSGWADVGRGRGARDRAAAGPVPEALPLLDADHRELLRRWVRKDTNKPRRTTLMNEAASIERGEALCDLLLREGWLVRHEKLVGGTWHWEAISWRDLTRLQELLGVTSRRGREEERQARLEQASAWLQARREETAASALDPDLLDELTRALEQLRQDRMLPLTRLGLLQSVAAWHDAGAQGSRRDFALRARGTTKSLTEADWRWLEAAFDLERLRIARFAPVAWMAGDLVLRWGERQVDAGALHCVGLPLSDLGRADAATGPQRYWLIENRASFERQAQSPQPGRLLVWLPGRPSTAWLEAMAHLLALAPAPAWISADADPAGVDIACTAGTLWEARGLAWEPHLMGAEQLAATGQDWPLNDHDRTLLANLLARPGLPPEMRALCEAMQLEGRKAEQEAWL